MMAAVLVVAIALLSGLTPAGGANECCSNSTHLLVSNFCPGEEEVLLACSQGYYRLDSSEDEDQFWTHKNGSVTLHDGYEPYEYCMSSVKENGTSRPIALVCFDWEYDSLARINVIIMIISVPFLIITIVIYASIPALRDLSGKCLIGYLVNLSVSDGTIILRDFVPDFGFELCSIRGAVLYFSTMSAFAWLNLVTFNVWKSVRNKVFQMTDKKLFNMYLIWSIGLPVTLCLIVILLDLIPGSHFKGHFSMFDCWFSNSMGFWMLFYVPLTILIVLNIIMFLHSCWVLWRDYKDPSQSRIKILRFKCLFILRLFLLSGIPWIFDVISVPLEEDDRFKSVWFIFDCFNSAQGIVLFVILVACHKRVLRAIHQQRFCGLKWPDSWGEFDGDSTDESEIDKVAMEQMKQNNNQ